MTWITKSSKMIIKDRWISLRADSCETDKGIKVDPYYVLEYPDSVHMTVFDEQAGKFLVVRQYRHAMKRHFTEFPGGYVESKDVSPVEAAKRELMEETGISGEFQLAGIACSNPANNTNTIYTYLVTQPQDLSGQELDANEEIEFKYLEYAEILKLIDTGEFRQMLHIGSLFMAARKLDELKISYK